MEIYTVEHPDDLKRARELASEGRELALLVAQSLVSALEAALEYPPDLSEELARWRTHDDLVNTARTTKWNLEKFKHDGIAPKLAESNAVEQALYDLGMALPA